MKRLLGLIAFLVVLTACGCGGDGAGGGSTGLGPSDPTYAERISSGWMEFSAGQYAAARTQFTAAIAADPAPLQGWVGLGWCEMMLEDLPAAHEAFEDGSGHAGADADQADLHAGWAFVWNARKTVPDNFSQSNEQIAQVEALEANWTLDAQPAYDIDDLTILAAENHFALGEFDSSLARVQVLNPSFTTDVSTPEGQAELAERIESLRAGTPGRP